MVVSTVPERLKVFIDCSEFYSPRLCYADMLIEILPYIAGYPKIEIGGDPGHEVNFVTTENYNEEKYELLNLDYFNITSFDDDEVVVCGGNENNGPLTFTIKVSDKTGKLQICDVFTDFTEGDSLSEFSDHMKNI